MLDDKNKFDNYRSKRKSLATPSNARKRLAENGSMMGQRKKSTNRPSATQFAFTTSSTTPNPQSPLGLAASGHHEDTGHRGALNPKRWRPSYDTTEINEILRMSNGDSAAGGRNGLAAERLSQGNINTLTTIGSKTTKSRDLHQHF